MGTSLLATSMRRVLPTGPSFCEYWTTYERTGGRRVVGSMVAARLHARWKQPRRRRLCQELTESLCEISPPPHLATGQSLCGLRLKGTSLPGWLRTPRSAKDPFYACSVPHFLTGAAVSIRFCHGAPLAPMKPVKPISAISSCPYVPDYAGLFGGNEPRVLTPRASSPMRPFPPCARFPAEKRREDEAPPLRTKSPPLPFSVFFSSPDRMARGRRRATSGLPLLVLVRAADASQTRCCTRRRRRRRRRRRIIFPTPFLQ